MQRQSAQHKLEKAYFDMLEDTPYSKISVTDIIRKSEVSRTTFYRHYDDIFDMHKKVSERFANEIVTKSVKLVIRNILTAHSLDFNGIIEIINSQEKYILLIAGKNGSRYFFEALYRKAVSVFDSLTFHLSDELIFRIKFIIVAIISFYVRDLIEGREHNFDVINISSRILNHKEIAEDLYGN